MERMMLLIMTICLVCYLAWYFLCETMLSSSECFNRCRHCADVYDKVDLLDERTKALILSSELIDNLKESARNALSQHEALEQEVKTMKTLCNDNNKATSSLRTDMMSLDSKLDSLGKQSSEFNDKHNFEMEALKQHFSKSDNAVKKLINEKKSTSDQLESIKTHISNRFGETQSLISEITSVMERNSSSYESKRGNKFSTEMENVDHILSSLDLRLKDVEKSLYTSFEMLNDTVENIKDQSTQNLKEALTEIKDNINSIKTKANDLEKYKDKVEDIIDIENKANSEYDRSLKTITENSNEFSGNVNELKGLTESKTTLTSTDLKELISHVAQSKEDLENQIKNEIETLRSEVYRSITILDKRLQELSAYLKTYIKDTNKRLSKLEDDMKDHKYESPVKKDELKKYLIQENAAGIQTKVYHLLEEVHTDLHQLKNDIGQLIKDEVEQLSKQVSKVNQTLAEKQRIVEIISRNIFNKEMFIVAILLIVVLLAINCCIVYVLVKRTSPQSVVRRQTTNNVQSIGEKDSPSIKGHHEVLRSIPVGQKLEPGVCIISFDEARTKTHKRLLDSANIPNCKVEGHVIRRHEHIPKLPRCKVYLMCTEFSERHVIIEEPGKGLGDLHKTTYDAVMKLGGCLIILYTRDPGSRNLKDKVRYNERIYCVSNQPELAKLNQDGSFFSVYDNLNNYQKTELRKKVTENMI